MTPTEKVPCIALVCLVLATSVLWVSTLRAQEADFRDVYDFYKNEIKRGPVPGRIIVSVSQTPRQADFFSMRDNKVVFKSAGEANARLGSFKVQRAYKAFHLHGNAVYVLTFADYGNEREIIRYLESLPGVQYAEQDYYLELLAEPNDRYYASSTANWWVPDDIESGATPARVPWGCPTNPPYAYWALRDTSELDDQWYLKHVQANKAWDIQRGDTTVKVMVMDSGIDIWHQDLYANIWKNPADIPGDMSSDGLPGDKTRGDIDNDGGMHFNDPDVMTKDFNKNGTLFGPDSTCDAGPDGDYGFGPNAIDDPPAGPGGGDDDTLLAGPGNDPWDDNLRGPGCLNPQFDDDMWEVQFLKNDDDENGYPDDRYGFNFLEPDSLPVDQGCPITEACHGTGMAGIIGAVTNNGEGIAGVLWNCRLVSGKIALGFPENGGNDNIPRIAEALYYAADNGIDVVNMSLGYIDTSHVANYNSPIIQQAVDYAYNHGVVVIAGAGNKSTGHYWYPASLDHVISVSGTNRFDKKASYTEYNDKVDVCAPVAEDYLVPNPERGDECVTTGFALWPYPMYNLPGAQLPHDYVITYLRTSGATAQVSGLAGLLVSQYPKSLMQEIMGAQYSPAAYVDFIENQMERGCVAISDTFYTTHKLGAGRINAYRSLTQWGRIRSDTTWTKFAYVSADLKIDEGKTLTIEPGTTIYFAPDDNENMNDPTVVEFLVDGTLIAEGTASNPIEFRSFAESPQPGDWSGLQVIGNAASASLSYCNISDAYHGIKSYRLVELSHCNISNCQVHGIYLEGSGVNGSEISDCTMNDNGSCGIMIDYCNNMSISDCECNNDFRGMWLGFSTGSFIENTQMKFNTESGLKATYGSNASINWCTVEDNDQQGIYLSESNAGISNTKIWKNTANGLYCVGSSSNPEVEYSKIEQNAVGVRAASGACPILGDIERNHGQYNSIYNQPLYVYSTSGCTIKAENCWWGTKPGKPPSPAKFLGDVDYYPWLDSDPIPYLAPSAPKKPTILSLAQNFPNPSVGAGITRITYSIPYENESERVNLAIFDVSGRRIRTLVDEAKAAGTYQAYWDGKGERGQNVAPGIYFYKLTVGKSSISKKLILFR